MSFTVLLHPKAAKELEKIENTIKARIVERLRDLKDSPERVGDYRAIYEIDRARRQVVVLFVGHRKNVYDDFSKLF